MNKILVIGSYNVGLFLQGTRLPGSGETLIANTFFESGGGKGSNQALTCAKMDGDICLLAHIGKDKYGDDAMAMYSQYGMDTSGIIRDADIHSGISVIFIDGQGNNSIMVVPGANYRLSKQDINWFASRFPAAYIAGFQLENDLSIVTYGIKKFHNMGVKTLLDPAPAVPLPEDLYPYIDYLKPNEHEASILTGMPVHDVESAARAGEWLLRKGTGTAVITLGRLGAVVISREVTQHYPAPDVKAIDTTGAGDCFSGTLMTCLAKGENLPQAVEKANYASALSVTKYGVIDAIPSMKEMEEWMHSYKEMGK